MESPGAPRTLRFTWPDNAASNAAISLSQPALSPARENADGGSELYFTRTARGTRNLWRASIKFDTAPVISPSESDTSSSTEVVPRPRALGATEKPLVARALTELAAPLFAENAVPLPNSRFVLCTTNATGRPENATRAATGDALDVTQRSQIARLDLRSGRFSALTGPEIRSYSPTLSPDGRRLAFVVQRAGLESIYVARLDEDGNFIGAPRRAVAIGRRPAWLNNGALIFQSTRPGQQGLYQMSLRHIYEGESATPGNIGADPEPPNLLFARAGTSAVSPDGRHLCVAAESNQSAIDAGIPGSDQILPTLYWLASDGSGARLISSSEGAANPSFTPHGSALLYDAPLDGATGDNQGTASTPRALWLVPMLRVPPTAVLLDARATTKPLSTRNSASAWQEIEILGTIFASGDDAPQVKLEWGEGSEPTTWNNFTGVRAPAHASTLAVWRMPADARGQWTLRLSVTDSSGDRAESTLAVTLPLPQATASVEAAPPVFARTNPVLPQIPATRAPLTAPNVTVVPGAPPAITPSSGPSTEGPRAPSSTQPTSRTRTAPETQTPIIRPFDPSGGARIPDQPALQGAAPQGAMPQRTVPQQTVRGQRQRTTQNLQIATGAGVAQALAALPPPAPERPAPERPTPERLTTAPGARRPSTDTSPSVPTPSVPTQRQTSATETQPPLSGSAGVSIGTVSDGPVPIAPAFPNPTATRPHRATNAPTSTSAASAPVEDEESGELSSTPSGGPLPRVPPMPVQPGGRPTTQRVTSGRSTQQATRPQRSVRRRGDAAVLSASGFSSSVEAGSELSVSVGVRNVGTRAWSSDDTQPVRLLVRWHDVTTGRRARWEIKWLRADVAPAGSTRLSADITVPPRAGQFILYLSLVRLNGSRYEAPSIDTSRDENEFGAVSYRITVR
jgi:hypothetical protein